jgi:hypothetical protein
MIRGDGWRFGVEAEMNPIDGQAILRRLALKRRDGLVDGVILLLPDTHQSRQFRREFAECWRPTSQCRQATRYGVSVPGSNPAGSTVIIV